MTYRVPAERTKENQRLFRAVNDRIRDLQASFGYVSELSGWVCECFDPACVEQVALTVPEYDWARADPRHFVVVPGHVSPDVEQAVVVTGRFAVVERREALRRRPDELLYYYRLRPEPAFEYVGDLVREWTGYTPEEHYADPELGLRLVHPEDRDVLERIAARLELGPVEIRWIARDGRLVATQHRIVPVLDAAGDVVAVAGRATLAAAKGSQAIAAGGD